MQTILNNAMKRREFIAANSTDNRPPFTPTQVAARWSMHVESIRRMLRQRRLASIIIARRRLIPASEVERSETQGLITRAA